MPKSTTPRSFAAIRAAMEAVQAKQDNAVREMHTIHENPGGPEMSLTPGQTTRFKDMETVCLKTRTELNELRSEFDEALIRQASNPNNVEGPEQPPTALAVEARAHAEVRDQALRAIEGDTFSDDGTRQRATVLAEADEDGAFSRWAATVANPHYMRAWSSMLVDPERAHLGWSAPERAAFSAAQALARSINIGTDAQGGYLVPFALDPSIILTSDGTLNPIRAIARKATIATSAWHGITSAGTTSEWKAEAAEVADKTPADFARPEIPVHMADTFIKYTVEAEQDLQNLVNELREMMNEAKDQHEATAFTVGSGVGQPKGVVTAVAADAGSIVAPTTAETFAIADIYKVAAALPPRHQGRARWLANHTLGYKIRQFATGSNASAFWAELADGTPPRLVGKPYEQCADMDGTFDSTVTAAHNFLMLFGDFQKYLIVDRIGTTTEMIPHLMGANGRPTLERGLVMYWRVGADALDTNAFRMLDIPTTA